MKTIILAVLLASASFHASAKRTADECAITANVYMVAADVRDSGQAPEIALERTQPLVNGSDAFPINYRKAIINLVYFEPAYSIPGPVLSRHMYENCINERPTFKPLK